MRQVGRINPYLHDAETIIVRSHSTPLSPSLPGIQYGNKPSDGGHLIIESEDFPHSDPIAQKYVRRYVGSQELLHAEERYCIWIPDSARAPDYTRSSFLRQRIEDVRKFRSDSSAADTRKYAAQPYRFFRIPQPQFEYIAIPRHVSANRPYFTVAHLPPDTIASDAIYTAVDPDKIVFALLSSSMFIAWLRAVGGQLKNDLRFSQLVYNSFPVPEITDQDRQRMAQAGDQLLSARASQPDLSLAELYSPLQISSALLSAHRQLDQVVDRIFKRRGAFANEAERVATLFDLYRSLATAGRLAEPTPRRPRRSH